MAKMLPPLMDAGTESAAERKLFDKMRDELPNSWAVFHSVGLPNHSRKLWAEIDFVLVGPPGAFCVEVKGGGISRRDDEWFSVDRNGVEHRFKDPVDQVGSASSALYAFLRDGVPEFGSTLAGYFVAFPDVDRPPEDLVADLEDPIFLYEDYLQPCSEFMERQTKHWTKKVEGKRGTKVTDLSPKAVREVVERLRHDFDLRPSVSVQIGQVDEQLVRYTEEQYQVLDGFADAPRLMIHGGAGTGKTWLALEEAKRRAAEGQRVLLTCYNKRLGEMLARETAGIDLITAKHMHGWMDDLIREAGDEVSGDATMPSFWGDEFPLAAVVALDESRDKGAYDALIVDEAQDLLHHSLKDVWDAALRGGMAEGHWRLFYDEQQTLFDEINQAIHDDLWSKSEHFKLTVNCRNTQSISAEVTKLSAQEMPKVLKAEGPPVAEQWFRSTEDLHVKLCESVDRCVAGGVAPNDIVILARRKLENTPFADGIIGCRHAIQVLGATNELDPSKVVFSTISAFKGLEAPAVIVYGIDEPEQGTTDKGMYVALSRAKALLIPIMDVKLKAAYMQLSGQPTPRA